MEEANPQNLQNYWQSRKNIENAAKQNLQNPQNPFRLIAAQIGQSANRSILVSNPGKAVSPDLGNPMCL